MKNIKKSSILLKWSSNLFKISRLIKNKKILQKDKDLRVLTMRQKMNTLFKKILINCIRLKNRHNNLLNVIIIDFYT